MYFEAEKKSLEVAVTGDSLITRAVRDYREPDFLALRDLILEADVRFTNLEVVLGESPDYPAEHCGGNWLGVPATLADDLSWLGFNLFSAANNHGGDFGTGGILSTIRELRARNLAFAGAGENLTRARQPGYMDLGKGRVALIAATSSLPHGHAAGEQRQDMIGRPGVNPLRHETHFRARPETIDLLKKVAEETEISLIRGERIKNGHDKPDADGEFKFLDAKFVASDTAGVSTKPKEKDMSEIIKWVKDARRQAEFCFVSLHAHESRIHHTRPAEFVEIFCRACIDAGADAVFGHGPHILRGIEIYKGKPILYSLGNFFMQSPTMQRIPVGMYERYNVDPFAGTPADIFDNRLKEELIRQNPIYYESVVARLSYQGGDLTGLLLYPTHLGADSSRPQQGRPILARGEMALKILKDMQDLSAPYGTTIDINGEVGYIRI